MNFYLHQLIWKARHFIAFAFFLIFSFYAHGQPPLGLSMLYCTDPPNKTAKASCNQKLEILSNLKTKNIAISLLFGGSFGHDPVYLKNLIYKLNQSKRLHLLVYLTNGSSQRSWEQTSVQGLMTKLNPENNLGFIQEQFNLLESELEKVIAIFKLNKKLGGVNRLVPQLEDNLTDEHYKIFSKKIKKYILSKHPDLSDLEYGRDACQCFKNAGNSILKDEFRVSHIKSIKSSIDAKGVVTNDGAEVLFTSKDKTDYPRSITTQDIVKLRDQAIDKKAWFLLWSAKAQGLNHPKILPPKDRIYSLYSSQEVDQIKNYILITPLQ